MHKGEFIHYGSLQLTKIILYGSLGISVILTMLLLSYDITASGHLRVRSLIAFGVIAYLGFGALLLQKRHIPIVSWMIIVLYASLSFVTLLDWGLNTPAGIFATSFIIILAGALLGSRAIFPALVATALLLTIVQSLHTFGVMTPNLSALLEQSSYLDVITYTGILAGFSLITWLSRSQIERSLARATSAEAAVRTQKETIAHQLEQESAKLRQTQMQEIQQLYKFAMLGQSAAATLHELSNHLSILNIDISDLKQQHQNSRAIAHAEESITQINTVLRQVKRRIHTYDSGQTFQALPIITQAIQDQQERYRHKHVHLSFAHKGRRSAIVPGDPLALSQVLTILLSNALDACNDLPHAKVQVRTVVTIKQITIDVIDNGVGISDSLAQTLFSPMQSTKPSGMGVGLYIAKHLIETQCDGTIVLQPATSAATHGAHFTVTLRLQGKK